MDEERLAKALRGEDLGARQELLDAYGDRLLRSAFLLCGNETDAQDLVQETFLQAIRSAHRFRGRSTVYTWLHAILLNLARHYHRDRKRVVYDDDLVNREIAAPTENPNRLDIETTFVGLADALRQLSGPHREILILRYYENMKIREMARHLGISKGTVKSRLHYAVEQMRRLLPEELNLFGVPGTEKAERL